MNKITQKARAAACKGIIKVGMIMRQEGMSDLEILRAVRNHIDLKKRAFYKKSHDAKHLADIMENLKKPDSKAEVSFLLILEQNKIPFVFQREIGPYRVDFLIGDTLILEIDGPHHSQQKDYDNRRDKYLQGMGYKILRIPIWVAANDSKSIIKTIKEILNT